jgi:hypothetical protein
MSGRVIRSGLILVVLSSLVAGCLPGQLTKDAVNPASDLPLGGPTIGDSAKPTPYQSVARSNETADPVAPPPTERSPDLPAVEPAFPEPKIVQPGGSTNPPPQPLIINGPVKPALENTSPAVRQTNVTVVSEPDLMSLVRSLRTQKGSDEALRRSISRLDETRQQLLYQLLSMSSHLGEPTNAAPLSPKELSELLQQFESLTSSLRQHAPLQITKACFCSKRPLAFGAYEPLGPEPRYQAGADGKAGELVHLYLEVRNFATREVAPQTFQTGLAAWLEFKSLFNNASILSIELPTRYDRSLTPRQDYYIYIAFNIPPRLSPGTYELALGVRDDYGIEPATGRGRTALNRQLSFQVVGSGPDSPMQSGSR